MDHAISKLTRRAFRKKAASAQDVSHMDVDPDDAAGYDGVVVAAVAADRDAFNEAAISSLLDSTFSGSELAHHLPFQVRVNTRSS